MSKLFSATPALKSVPASVVTAIERAFKSIATELEAVDASMSLYSESDLPDAFGGADNVAELARLRTVLGNALGQLSAPTESEAAEAAASEKPVEKPKPRTAAEKAAAKAAEEAAAKAAEEAGK